MDQLEIDKHIIDMIYSEEIREDYADLIIEDLMEEIEDMEDEE